MLTMCHPAPGCWCYLSPNVCFQISTQQGGPGDESGTLVGPAGSTVRVCVFGAQGEVFMRPLGVLHFLSPWAQLGC